MEAPIPGTESGGNVDIRSPTWQEPGHVERREECRSVVQMRRRYAKHLAVRIGRGMGMRFEQGFEDFQYSVAHSGGGIMAEIADAKRGMQLVAEDLKADMALRVGDVKGVMENAVARVRSGMMDVREEMMDVKVGMRHAVGDIRTDIALSRAQVCGSIDKVMKVLDEGRAGLSGVDKELKKIAMASLLKAMDQLASQYRDCYMLLKVELVPSVEDCEDLRKDARTALAELRHAMQHIPQGDPERLPLMRMYVFASRANVDAHDMRSLHSSASSEADDMFRTNLLHTAMDHIKDEVRAFIDASDKSPYSYAAVLHPKLQQYVQLHNALTLALQTSLTGSSEDKAESGGRVDELTWEDGLEPLRDIMSSPPKVEDLYIRTASDMELPPGTSPHFRARLAFPKILLKLGLADKQLGQSELKDLASELRERLGIPASQTLTLSNSTLATLKKAVSPHFLHNAEEKLQHLLSTMDIHPEIKLHRAAKCYSEFGWSSVLVLIEDFVTPIMATCNAFSRGYLWHILYLFDLVFLTWALQSESPVCDKLSDSREKELCVSVIRVFFFVSCMCMNIFLRAFSS